MNQTPPSILPPLPARRMPWGSRVARGCLGFALVWLLTTTARAITYIDPEDAFGVWNFDNAALVTQANDSLYNIPLLLQGKATFSAAAAGRSGTAGDRALNFGTAGGSSARVNYQGFLDRLNESNRLNDQLTIVFWQKWATAVGSNSVVWGRSTSANSDNRGWQAHIPWSDNNIYFDTSGCCNAPAQRLSVASGTALPGINWQEWHHIALVKNRAAKQIWVDGQLIASQTSGVSALLNDWTEILLGQQLNSTNYFKGLLDDFAVFGTALDSSQIAAIAAGTPPADLVVPPQNRPPQFTTLTPPDGTTFYPPANGLGFTVTTVTPNTIAPANVRVLLNGADVSASMSFGGSDTSRTVTFTGTLLTNRVYTVQAEATDSGGRMTSQTWSFHTAAPPLGPLNLAAVATANQSSTNGSLTASLALDGNAATWSETSDALDSYWLLTLDPARPLRRIELINRSDANSTRMGGLTVRVLDAASNTLAVATVADPGPSGTWGFDLPDGTADACFVRIGLENGALNGQGNRIVSLAEVSLFTGVNYALNMPAYMVRLVDTLPAPSNANDGYYATHTETTTQTVDGWWETDLGTERSLHCVRVVAYDSGDNQIRLRHATVRLFDANHDSVYSEHLSGTSAVFDVKLPGPVTARYVRVGFENKERSSLTGGVEWWLRLREVQAFGEPVEEAGLTAFTATPAAITAGQTATLQWSEASLFHEVAIFPGFGSVDPYVNAQGQGTLPVSPSSTTEYLLVGKHPTGTITRFATVQVDGQDLPPRISEFVADNRLSLRDGYRDASDWIEIHNPNNTPLDLSGYGLSDNPASRMKWTFPAGTTLAPHAFLVVFASGRDTGTDPEGNLHAAFNLSAGGEAVLLTKPDGLTVVDSLASYPSQLEDLAYGRSPDGAWAWFTPTPGAANLTTPLAGWLSPPVFSHSRGFCDSPFTLTISHGNTGAELLYSLDGSEPSLVYSGPITVNGSVTVRAKVRRSGWFSPRAATHTYLFRDSVMASPLMSTTYTQGALASRLRDSLAQLPSICISVPQLPDDYNEREASLEIFLPDGTPHVQLNAGLNRVGGSWTNFAKKSYRVSFRPEYGTRNLESSIFRGFDHGMPVADEIDTLDLGAGNHDMVDRGFYMANRFVEDTMLEMGSLNPHGRFVHVYINGTYWGQYNAHERLEDSFLAGYLGGRTEDYVNVKGNDNVAGDPGGSFVLGTPDPPNREPWETVRANRSSYLAVKDRLDVSHLIDFMLVWFYGNPESEFRCAGPVAPGSGFKFWLADADGFLRTSALNLDYTANKGPGGLFGALVAEGHPDFKTLLADRIYRHLFNQGALTQERNLARLNARMNEIKDSLIAECARWKFRDPTNWESAAETIRTGLFPQRTANLFNYLRTRGLYPTINPPVLSQHGGSVAAGSTLTLNAGAGTIHYTLDGTDPRLPGGGIAPGTLTATGSTYLVLQQNTRLKARLLNGGNWSALADATFHVAHPLAAAGPYLCSQWDPASPAGSAPPNMRFFQADLLDPPLAAAMDAPWSLGYNLESRSRINGLGDNGFAFLNTSNPQLEPPGAGFVGAAVLALNTLGAQDIRVTWTGGTVVPNDRDYGIRLQYRVGGSGNYLDVTDTQGNPVEYLRHATAGHSAVVGPVSLPVAAENQALVGLRWKYHFRSGTDGSRPQLRVDDIQVAAGPVVAEALAMTAAPATAQRGSVAGPVTVQVRGRNNALAQTYTGDVTVAAAGQTGFLTGTTTRPAVNGIVTFDDLVFPQTGAYTLTATAAGLTPATHTVATRVAGLTELVMPRFIQGDSPDNTRRVPFACCCQIDGLLPNTTYRYANQIVNEDDVPSVEGAGNMVFVDPSGGPFLRATDSPRFLPADYRTRHDQFVTDAAGSHRRWFVIEPTGNVRFTPGNQVRVRILLNDGEGGDLAAYSLTAAGSVQVLAFGTGAGNGSAVHGTSAASPRNFLVLHDNPAGTGRPLAATPVEATAVAPESKFASFYQNLVFGLNGKWGSIVPNALPAGVQCFEERSLLTGETVAAFASPDGHRPTTALAAGDQATGVQVPAATAAGFACWQARQFTLAQIQQPDLGGPTGDADRDGVVNLLEYAFGSDPFQAGTTVLPSTVIESYAGSPHLVFRFRRLTGNHGLVYAPQVSTDATAWQEEPSLWNGTEESILDPGGRTETVTRRLPVLTNPGNRFVRLRVTSP